MNHVGNLSDLDSDWMKQLRAFINAQVRDYMHRGGRLNHLALKANLAPLTVSRLAYYETTRPMARTIDGIIMALELYEEVGQMMVAYGRSRNSIVPASGEVPTATVRHLPLHVKH